MKGQLEELGFKRSNANHRVFTKIINRKFFVIVVYVDNFLLFSFNINHIRTIKKDLKRYFKMKDLEEVSWILQMKIERLDMMLGLRILSILQEKYAEVILEQHGMMNSNPVKTSMMANLQLPRLTEAKIDIMEYQRCIGFLMYFIVYT